MKNPIAQYIQFVKTIERAKREGRTDELLRAAKEKAEIQKTMLRPMRSETINGSGEIGWGMFCLCMALSSYSSAVLPNSMWRFRAGIGGLLMVCGCLAMPLCRWAVRKYVTQPRTGYVAFRRGRIFWITIVTSMLVSAGISIGLVFLMRPEMIHMTQSQAHSSGTNATAAIGTISHASKIMLAVLIVSNTIMYLMMNAVSIREHRWKWLLLVLIALGPLGICCLDPGNYIEMFRPLGLFFGLVWLFSGTVTMVSFIRHNQPPALESE